MEKSYQIIVMLLISVLIGYLAGTIIRLQPRPVYLRVSSVETKPAISEGNDTVFELQVTIEAWNGRYRNIGIRHGENCGIVPGITSSVEDFVWLSPPYCDPSLDDEITVIKPGLNTYEKSIHILFPGNHSDLPAGDYQIYPLPSYVGYRYNLNLTITEDNEQKIDTAKPENWGKTLIFHTPLTWYFPTFILFIATIANIINRIFGNQITLVNKN